MEKAIKIKLDVNAKTGQAVIKKTSAQMKTFEKDATKSGAAISSGMKKATTDIKALGKSADKTSKQIKGIGVSATKSSNAIQRTSAQLKGLNTAALASGAAISTGTKVGAGGMLLLSAAAVKASSGIGKISGATKTAKEAVERNVKAYEKYTEAYNAGPIDSMIKDHLRKTKVTEDDTKSNDENTKSTKDSNKELLKQEKNLEKLTKSWGRYKTAMVATGVAMAAIYGLYKMMKPAAAAEQQKKAFENLANSHGVSADKIIADLKKVSSQTVDTATIIQKAGTAIMMGIDPTKLSKLMEIAAATSRMTGQTVVEAFDNISMAVGRQSKMILDNLGIIIRIEQANKAYAKQMGITGRELTDVEKKQAFLNETLKIGDKLIKSLGATDLTEMMKIERFEASVKDLTIALGKVSLVFTPIIEELTDAANNFTASITAIGLAWEGKITWTESALNPVKAVEDYKKSLRKVDSYVGVYSPGGKSDDIEIAKMKAANHEKILSYISTELENKKRAVAQEVAMIATLIEKQQELGVVSGKEATKLKMDALKVGQAKLDKIMEEEAEKRRVKHEEVLQFISTEQENEIRALLATQELLLKKTDILEEQNAIRERTSELISEVYGKESAAIEEWVGKAQASIDSLKEASLSAVESFSSGMANAFFEFTEGTKSAAEAFEDFARSFIGQVGRMITQMLILKAIQGIAGYFSDGGVVTASSTYGGNSGLGTGMSGTTSMMAKGGVFSQGHKMREYAKGGIVNTPTIFPMAGGAGLMGEDGPEGILPLKRGAGGRLGVEASGQSQPTTVNVNYTINAVDSASFAELTRRNPEAIAGPIIEQIQMGNSGLRQAINIA